MGKIVRCKYCGEEIELIRTNSMKTIPCQRTSVWFTPSGGPDTFVTDSGEVLRGEADQYGKMKGHPKHLRYCKESTTTGRL